MLNLLENQANSFSFLNIEFSLFLIFDRITYPRTQSFLIRNLVINFLGMFLAKIPTKLVTGKINGTESNRIKKIFIRILLYGKVAFKIDKIYQDDLDKEYLVKKHNWKNWLFIWRKMKP